MNGRRVEGPFFMHVLLFERRQFAGAVHQHQVAFGGVEVGNGVQAVVVVAKTRHKREQVLYAFRSPRETITKA